MFYEDLGGDFYAQRNPNKTKQRAHHQLNAMGYNLTLSPRETAVAR